MREGEIKPTENYLNLIAKIMKENYDFVREKADETYTEVIELINDAIDYLAAEIQKGKSKDDYVKDPMLFFIVHILMPQSYAIHTDLLMGNLPACFMELRLMLEAMVKCYFASLHPDKNLFFELKIISLEDWLSKQNISTSKFLEEIGKEIGVKRELVALWGKLSRDWIHPRGIVERIVNKVVEKADVPPWALAIPMNYTENDLDDINELRKRVSQFRRLLRIVVEKYKTKNS